MDRCTHLDQVPTDKTEGGYCLWCERWCCLKCILRPFDAYLTDLASVKLMHKVNQSNNLKMKALFDISHTREMLGVCEACAFKLNQPVKRCSLWCCW